MRFTAVLLLLAACATATPELELREREFNDAFRRNDANAIQSLVTSNYQYTWIDRSGSATPNAPRGKWPPDMTRNVKNGVVQTKIIDTRIACDVGTVVAHYRWIGTWHGQPFFYEGIVTDTWIQRDGKWLLMWSDVR